MVRVTWRLGPLISVTAEDAIDGTAAGGVAGRTAAQGTEDRRKEAVEKGDLKTCLVGPIDRIVAWHASILRGRLLRPRALLL